MVLQWKILVFFSGQFATFLAIWYILWPFGIFFPILVCGTQENLATLLDECPAWFTKV
jgi:hypothetical protein